MTASPALTRTQVWTIFVAAWATTAIAAGFAFLGPVLTLLLERMTGSGSFIGAFATVGAVTTVALTPLAPKLMSRVGAPTLVTFGILGACACFPLYYLIEDPVWWFAIRFTQGLFTTIVFVVSETWINTIAPEDKRGRILSVYAIFLAGGFGVGAAASAILIQTVGLDGWVPFAVGAAVVGLGLLPLLVRAHLPMNAPRGHDSGVDTLFRIMGGAPGLMAAVFAFGAIEYSLFHMVPVYGVRLGMSEGAAALLLMSMPLGSILFIYPIGMAADRFPRKRVLMVLFGFCAVLGIGISVLSDYWALMAAFAIWVGAAGGLYTVGLSMLSERHRGARMAAANAAFIMVYGMGSLASPYAIGAGLDAVGPGAMPQILSGVCALAMGVFALTDGRREGGWRR